MDEFPHRPVVDHETALSQLGHEPPQGEAGLTAALHQPGTVIAGNLLRLVPAHLTGTSIAGGPKMGDPCDQRARSHPAAYCRRAPR
jgi:hypothetical protein